MKWYFTVLIILVGLTILLLLSVLFYKPFFKRFYDILISFIAIIVLLPLLILLTIVGTIAMKGNPFFIQQRPGKNCKIFKLIKFRTMTNEKDTDGKFLTDEQRLKKYGKFLRSTSMDELPELLNILFGSLSICGPRPLMTRYLSYYSEIQIHRQDVRPGLTGYAQVHGRNTVSWNDRINFDLYYINNISLFLDLKIIFKTIKLVFKKEGTNLNEIGNFDDFCQKKS